MASRTSEYGQAPSTVASHKRRWEPFLITSGQPPAVRASWQERGDHLLRHERPETFGGPSPAHDEKLVHLGRGIRPHHVARLAEGHLGTDVASLDERAGVDLHPSQSL